MAFHYGFTGGEICILGDLFGIKKSCLYQQRDCQAF